MAQPLTFRWVKRPSTLNKRIEEEFGEGGRIYMALHALAAHWGASVQNAARAGAKWEDRTGNARSGLFFAVDGFGLNPIVGRVTADQALRKDTAMISGSPTRMVIALAHTVFYGKFLELNGRYAIVMSTLESNLGRLEGMLRGLLR
ncbi:MAG: hypothetical protein JXR84_13180 [Anaerolineae bacterium]|nr:hypothetical protein [Anaerolineae bacterium]